MAFFAEERDEVSVETGNLGALGGGWVFNDHQKKTLLFLVSGKQPLFLSVPEKKTRPGKAEVEVWYSLIKFLSVWPPEALTCASSVGFIVH